MARGPMDLVGLCLVAAGCGTSPAGKSSADTTASPDSAADSGALECGPLVAPDPAGCISIEESDPEARGRWPDLLRRQFDARGHEVSRDVRGGEQPDTELVCRTEWDGDDILSEQCAGVSVYTYTYTYDAPGFLAASTYDAGSDGVLDKVWSHLTDADGHVVETTVDDDLDGEPEAVQTFAWDAGHLVEETWDYTYDGAIDYRRTLEWRGDLLASEAEDTDGDGTVDREMVYTYDELDRPVEALLYKDGSDSVSETTRWTYVDCALDSRTVTDAGGNRTALTYTVDDLGRVVLEVEDWDADGSPDRLWATDWICPGDDR